MLEEKKFLFDIENLKKDLAMEDMIVTEEDINMLRKYANDEITVPEMIETIKNTIIEGK